MPTPIAIIISAAAFALAHLTPGEFPQLFILGENTQLKTNSTSIFLVYINTSLTANLSLV